VRRGPPLHFNGHFPVEPGLAVFTEARDDGGGGDNWTTGAVSRASGGSSNFVSDRYWLLVTSGRVAMPHISPLMPVPIECELWLLVTIMYNVL